METSECLAWTSNISPSVSKDLKRIQMMYARSSYKGGIYMVSELPNRAIMTVSPHAALPRE